MIKIKNIIAPLALLFTLVSCQKEDLSIEQTTTPTTDVPEGFVAMPIDMSNTNFSEQTIKTRSSVPLIATTRELDLKNMKAYVFDNQTPILSNTLIEVQDVIRDYDALGNPTYYAVLMERNTPVRILGIANASSEKIEELIGSVDGGAYTPGHVELNQYGQVVLKNDGTDFDYEQFLYFAEMKYSFDVLNPDDVSKSNHVLKNNDSGLLPIYSESITFDKLNEEVLTEWERTNSLVSHFAYARIDVVLNDGKTDKNSPNYTRLLGVSAIEAPVAPANPITGMPSSEPRIRTHEVTPATNLNTVVTPSITYGVLPTGINDSNIDTKYLQGLYIYPTAPLKNSPADNDNLVKDNNPVYIIVRADMGSGNERYFKLMMRYTRSVYEEGEAKDEGETFFIYNSSRYLVNITKINSPGYVSFTEAENGPPSNVEYNISVDDVASDITSNGQYYLGVNKNMFEMEMGTYDSNMSEITHDYVAYSSNDMSWKIDNDRQVATVNFTLSYNGGVTSDMVGASPDDYEAYSKVTPDLLNCEIITESGLKCFYQDGIGVSLVEKLDGSGNVVLDAHGNVVYEEVETSIVAKNSSDIKPGDVEADWTEYFGTHNFKVEIPYNIANSKITVKIGELTHDITFNIKKTMITDYTNQLFINKLVTGDDSKLPESSVANSYIINPYDGANNEYYIPVIARINEFWSEYAKDKVSGVITASDWTNDSQFTVEPSWYDGEGLSAYTIEKATSPTGENAIRIKFNGSDVVGKHQNFAVNVKKSGKVIWSWHFWVTDYNPYMNAEGKRPTIGSQEETIPMQNGDLHRHGGSVWDSKLGGRAMMDRNLGALDTNFAGGDMGDGSGSLYYQYGRKDPFPGSAGKNANGSNFANNKQYNTKPEVLSMEESVIDPTIFITGATEYQKNWCAQIDVLQYAWHDYKASTVNMRKSIYDPSPLGWMVASGDAFANIDYIGWTTKIGAVEWIEMGTPGLRYYDNVDSTIEAFYPSAGYISTFSNGKLENATPLSDWNTYMWTAEPAGASTGVGVDQAKSFMAGKKIEVYPWGGSVSQITEKPALTPSSRANAMPVRAIQEGVY